MKELFERAGIVGAELLDARLIKSEQKLAVTIRTSGLVSMQKIEAAKAAVKEASGFEAELHLCCEGVEEKLCMNDKATLNVLKDAWGRILPVARPALASSCWQWQEGVLMVSVAKGFSALADKPEWVRAAEKLFASAYGMNLKIRVIEDAQIQPELPQSQPEPKPVQRKKAERQPADAEKAKVILGKAIKKSAIHKQHELVESMGTVTISGEVLSIETMARKGGGNILTVIISDHTGTLPCKLFLEVSDTKTAKALQSVKERGDYLVVSGRYGMDQWLKRMCVYPKDIGYMAVLPRMDRATEKRVELHLHTKMSAMDGLLNVKEAVKTAARWGHKAVAITDHGVVHAFPDAVNAAKKCGIKALLGVEGYLLPDSELIERPREYTAIYVTMADGIKLPEVFEIAACRFTENEILDAMDVLVDTGALLSQSLATETGLTIEMLHTGVPIAEALGTLIQFAGESVKVLHDAQQLKALYEYGLRFNMELNSKLVSTGMLSHYLHREVKEPTLLAMCKKDGILCGGRAKDRAAATARLMQNLLRTLDGKGVTTLPLTNAVPAEKVKGKRGNYHIILLAKNPEGLKNLYRLVSYAHMEYLKKVPQIPRSLLSVYREGLIVGSACEAGELFRALLSGAGEERLMQVAQMYDFLEIQPIANNGFLMRNGTVADDDGLRELNRRIVALGERMGKPVVATGDVHFLEPDHAIFRSIIMHARGFEDAEEQAPLYFKTTDEMLEEFSYLGEEKAMEVVVENPGHIADSCENLKPFLSEKSTYAPTFPGANEELRDMALVRAHEIYGDTLPDVVQKRLDKELNSIIGNGYASLYLMAQRLVYKSLNDGYLVGSRGSVGSSLVAHLAGITEVNALQPHYVCPSCRHSDFDVDRSKYACGVDMPDKDCPVCGAKYKKLGYEIPFEVFLGFKGDKTPDIDLNFSGEYQPVAHKFTETMFGEGHAFRAGTISGVKDKTVYGYVKAYCEDNGIQITKDEMERLVSNCAGVKKTTGQHPGGIVIVPEENDIMEFTPIQYPADRSEGKTVTTHFDFHAMDDRLVKLDILGHDDPTALRMLQDITGLDPRSISLDDPDTMKLFSSSEPLGVSLPELDCDVGSIAIPEFGTTFVRQILKDTRPTTMEELVRISGISHGTDVWVGNAQDLILSGTASLSEVICTRDDIMNYLILRGGDPSMSFKTMENVRKGKGVTEEMETHMASIATPKWFVASCKKIKYMFPRAHAAAYVMMAFRVAYYKVHMPLAFYTVYFTVRADAFDIAAAEGGADRVLKNIKDLKKKGNDMDNKEADLLTILEVVYEMNKRGIELLPIDLYKSEAREFKIEDGKIRPPYSSIAGVGAAAAEGIAQAAREGAYSSKEDFRRRSGANSAVVKALEELGCMEGIPETDQLCLF